jgi:hypothetical protein
MSYIRGRLYNRMKKATHAGINQHSEVADKMSTTTAELLASKHGIDERTIRRDGKRAEALDKLATSPVAPPQQAPAGPAASRERVPARIHPSGRKPCHKPLKSHPWRVHQCGIRTEP